MVVHRSTGQSALRDPDVSSAVADCHPTSPPATPPTGGSATAAELCERVDGVKSGSSARQRPHAPLRAAPLARKSAGPRWRDGPNAQARAMAG